MHVQTNCLSKPVSFTIERSTYNPCDFFKEGVNLKISREFSSFILRFASNHKITVPKAQFAYTTLLSDANDRRIRSELPPDYLFQDTDIFLCYLAKIIAIQKEGVQGVLNNDGFPNIFYLLTSNREVVVVRIVPWASGGWAWWCCFNRLECANWYAGLRIFTAKTG